MKKNYEETEICKRLDAILVYKNEGNIVTQTATIKETFFDSQLCTGSWVGFWFAVI